MRRVASCFVHEPPVRLLDDRVFVLCTSHTGNLASAVGTCLWLHSPATLQPCHGGLDASNALGLALSGAGAMLGAAAGGASARSAASR